MDDFRILLFELDFLYAEARLATASATHRKTL